MAKYLSRMSYFVDRIENQSCWSSFFAKPLNPTNKNLNVEEKKDYYVKILQTLNMNQLKEKMTKGLSCII